VLSGCSKKASEPAQPQVDPAEAAAPKPASATTIAANKALADSLNFADKQDFEDAQRGLIDAPATLTIKNDKGAVVWDLESYKPYLGLDKPAPDTVNPSLWRNAQLNMVYGLFKVTDRIYQVAENASHTLHNVLTLRGAKVRDPMIWARYLDETIDTWGGAVEAEFGSHHWPTWGNERIREFLAKQRDLYKYIHDQSVRLMNAGYTGVELSNMVKLPPELGQAWFNRDYYGTEKHDTRAVYQRYMGFYDANASTLEELPPVEAAEKYVEYMGGADG
jgi:alkyl sulfatase BDS1-like metallo-beta-lactamase superfamily hydrolase